MTMSVTGIQLNPQLSGISRLDMNRLKELDQRNKHSEEQTA